MSRSGYSDDCENLNLWRGAVSRAIKGKRGQAFLRELAAAMDAMPVKVLVANSFQEADGEFCTLGTVGAKRGIDMSRLVDAETDEVGAAFGIAQAMAAEIMFENDERNDHKAWVSWTVEGPMREFWPHRESHERAGYRPIDGDPGEARWQRMRKWVADHLSTGTQP